MRSQTTYKAVLFALFALILLGASFSAVGAVDGPTGYGTVPPRVDLAVKSVVLSPPSPRAGVPATVTVSVVNAGEVSVPGRRVYLYIDPAQSPPTSDTLATKEFVVGVEWPPGDAMTVEYAEFTFETPGCNHTIYAWVDPLDRIAEVDETNNLVSIDVCVGGDIYEDDDSCQQAKEIPTNGIRQERTFAPQGDVDWVKFLAQPDSIYTPVATGLGSQAAPVVQMWDSCARAAVCASESAAPGFCSPPESWRYLRIHNRLTEYDVDQTLYALEVYTDTGGSFGGDSGVYLPLISR